MDEFLKIILSERNKIKGGICCDFFYMKLVELNYIVSGVCM